MSSLIDKAAKPLRDAKVSGFATTTSSGLVYFGSFAWFLVLIGSDLLGLVSWDPSFPHNTVVPTVWTVISLNTVMFGLQAINLIYVQFKWWPLVALFWTCQLVAIGIASSWVARLMILPEYDPSNAGDVETNLALGLFRLFGQCLFTASQFSVTLEHLHRGIHVPRSVAPSNTIARTIVRRNNYPPTRR